MHDPSVDEIDIVAVDPGKTVGVAYLDRTGNHTSWQADVGDAVQMLWRALHIWHGPNTEYKPRLMVVERYQITPDTLKKTRQYDALEVIGALRYECLEHGVPFELQLKNAAFKIGTAARLRALGWYRPSKEHANVATGHLALALVRHSKLSPDVTQRLLRVGTVDE